MDDFESYTIDDGNRIYQTWIDGYNDRSSGSIVGYLDAPFTEQTIVFAGRQSMPFEYNNVDPPYYSEAVRTWSTPQDWTVDDADTLFVHVRGNPPGFVETASGITLAPREPTLEMPGMSSHSPASRWPATAPSRFAWTASRIPISGPRPA